MLLHADYASSREFEALFPELIKKFQVITMDYPGCGRSPRRALSYDYYKENAKAAVDIIRAKDLDPVWVIGSGGGAITALWMAIMAPSKIRGVIADSFTEFYEKKDIQRAVDFFTDAVLFDAFEAGKYGGTGIKFDWNIVGHISKRIFLAGGINPDNAAEAISPGVYGIDVCSGIESEPGKKDHEKMKQLFENIKHLRA